MKRKITEASRPLGPEALPLGTPLIHAYSFLIKSTFNIQSRLTLSSDPATV